MLVNPALSSANQCRLNLQYSIGADSVKSHALCTDLAVYLYCVMFAQHISSINIFKKNNHHYLMNESVCFFGFSQKLVLKM